MIFKVFCRAIVLSMALMAWAMPAAADARWTKAQAALSSGDLLGALPLLEALVATEPRNPDYRYELALTLHRLGLVDRASFHLDTLRGARLTDGEKTAVQELARAIDATRNWTGYFNFSIEPQSNVSGQTEQEAVDVLGVRFRLNEDALGYSGTLYRVAFGGRYVPTISPAWRADIGMDVEKVDGPDTILDEEHLSLYLGVRPTLPIGQQASFGIRLGHHHYGIGRTDYSRSLFASYSFRPSTSGQVTLAGTHRMTDYGDDHFPDLRETTVSIGYGHAIGGNARVEVSAYHSWLDDRSGTQSGRIAGIVASGLYAFKGGLIAGLSMSYNDDKRDGIVQVFGAQRHERKLKVETSFHHSKLRIAGFAPQLKVGHERNRSSIALTDYSNTYATIGFSKKF